MKLGVLLLTCKESRTVTFTRDWADRAVARLAPYYARQSGGQQIITHKVYDWVQLDKTQAEWLALGYSAYPTLKPSIEAAPQVHEHLDDYDHILIGIDTPTASGGTTYGQVTYLAASNFTPSLMAHELGHRFGAADAFGDTTRGPVVYQDRFCVMGGGFAATFADSSLDDPTAAGLNRSGPNMCVPTLLSIGWLKESDHGVGVDLSDSGLLTPGRFQGLSALEGAVGPADAGPPVMMRIGDLVVEYRMRRKSGWDQGLPDPGEGAAGWLVVHRSPSGAPSATYVDSLAARPGATLLLGRDSPVLDMFSIGPPRLMVTSQDPHAGTVRFNVRRRGPFMLLLSGRIFSGVDVGGGGLVWTPGRGFQKFHRTRPCCRRSTMSPRCRRCRTSSSMHLEPMPRPSRLLRKMP